MYAGMNRMVRRIILSGVVVVCTSLTAVAQGSNGTEEGQALTRFPESGLAIIDCAPRAPVPGDSCILRVPPSQKRGRIEKRELGEATAEFEFVRDPGRFGAGLKLSSTLILLDLSPGPNGARGATWRTERAMIADFLRAMPRQESIALYGFNETIERLADFTTDVQYLASLVEKLELRGTNTRIASGTKSAISILRQQENTILKNLILITDGDEEGARDPSEVTAEAIKSGVTVSALGMLWRPVGDAANGNGMDYLTLLTEGTLGTTQAVQLRRNALAKEELNSFIGRVKGSLSGSGLIAPVGQPVASDIIVTMQRPVIGQSGLMQEENIQARFIPVAERNIPVEIPEEKTAFAAFFDGEWFGYPKLWWVIGVGALTLGVLVVVALLILASKRKAANAEDELDFPVGDDDLGDLDPLPVAAPLQTQIRAAPPILAYLVRKDSDERLAVRKARTTIGRSESTDLIVADGSVSRLHAELERRNDGNFYLSDAGSLNGTKLNGKKLTGAKQVKPGDVVVFGSVELRFAQV